MLRFTYMIHKHSFAQQLEFTQNLCTCMYTCKICSMYLRSSLKVQMTKNHKHPYFKINFTSVCLHNLFVHLRRNLKIERMNPQLLLVTVHVLPTCSVSPDITHTCNSCLHACMCVCCTLRRVNSRWWHNNYYG